VPAPAAGLHDQRQGLLVEVVDEHQALRNADLAHQGDGPLRAALLVTVRSVDHGREAEVLRQLELRGEHLFFLVRDLVVADLTDADHTVLMEETREYLEHTVGDLGVVRLFRVERQHAHVDHAELAGAEPLPTDEAREVVDERADARTRLTLPERRLDHDGDSGLGHAFVVLRRSGGHVDVRVEHLHG
jgi:hypothetical protein